MVYHCTITLEDTRVVGGLALLPLNSKVLLSAIAFSFEKSIESCQNLYVCQTCIQLEGKAEPLPCPVSHGNSNVVPYSIHSKNLCLLLLLDLTAVSDPNRFKTL